MGTCILDDGSRSVGIVFRDPDQRSLYKVDLTVDNTHRKYSTVRVQFKEVGVLFRLRRHLVRVGRQFGKWFKNKKNAKGTIVEHKVKIPANVCKNTTTAYSILKSKSSDEVGCQFFINEAWATLNPFGCSRNHDTDAPPVISSFDELYSLASSFCLNPLSSEMIEELVAMRCSWNTPLDTKIVVKPSKRFF